MKPRRDRSDGGSEEFGMQVGEAVALDKSGKTILIGEYVARTLVREVSDE